MVTDRDVESRLVPESVEFKPDLGRVDVAVFDCVVCGERLRGSDTARGHTGCSVTAPCVVCGSWRVRPTRGVHGPVEECTVCGHVQWGDA